MASRSGCSSEALGVGVSTVPSAALVRAALAMTVRHRVRAMALKILLLFMLCS